MWNYGIHALAMKHHCRNNSRNLPPNGGDEMIMLPEGWRNLESPLNRGKRDRAYTIPPSRISTHCIDEQKLKKSHVLHCGDMAPKPNPDTLARIHNN